MEKEFAFTKLINCGLCGSGVSADEKFKKQKNGKIHRHVYYGCTKVRDRNCKSEYINEVDLIIQFEKLIDQIDVDDIGIKEKITEEVQRFKKFQQMLLGKKNKLMIDKIDIKNYAKYILREGKEIEKRELLGFLKNKITLDNKIIRVQS